MPSRNIQIAAGILVVVALLVIFKKGPPPVGPERAAEEMIDKAVEAVEAGEIGDFMDLVADDFSGHHNSVGTLNKSGLSTMLTRMSYMGGISITIATQDNTIGPDQRSVAIALRALVVAGGMRGALESQAEAREFHVDIELRDDEWLFVSAR
jgi:hypothetical protein